MVDTDLILELLEGVYPQGYCDDCLSKELDIYPRQQVNQINRKLKSKNQISRHNGTCLSCNKTKIVNKIVKSDDAPLNFLQHESIIINKCEVLLEPHFPKFDINKNEYFNIETARTFIVRICHEIWNKHNQVDMPRSISVVINILKSDNFLPSHQANMMLTICNLRNVFVYENIYMGEREINIALNAFRIIEEWWNRERNAEI